MKSLEEEYAEKKWGSFEDEWALFREKVIPSDVGELQLKEMKRSFYAGLVTAFYGVNELFFPEVRKDSRESKILAWLEELTVYAAKVKRGEA